MKKMLIMAAMTVVASLSQARVYVKSATLAEDNKNVVVQVLYSGGCSKHHFSLEIAGRSEINPLEIQASIKEISFDKCRLTIPGTLVFNLGEHKLNKLMFSSLNIKGDLASEAIVSLPNYERSQ